MKLTNEQQQEAAWKAWAADMVKKGNSFDDRDRLMFISGYQTKELDAIDEKIKELEQPLNPFTMPERTDSRFQG